MEYKTRKTPLDTLVRMQVAHFGKILFNFQFAALAIMGASMLTFILIPIYYILLIAISMITLFLIYLVYPEFASLWSIGETFTQIAGVLAESWKYTVPIVAILAVCSIICLSFDKPNKHTGRIVTSSIICVFAVAIIIVKLAVGGTAG